MWVLKKLNIWNYPTEPEPGVPADVTQVVEVETPTPAAAPKQVKEPQRKLNLEGEITILDKSLSMGVISNFYRFKVEDVDPDLKRSAKVIFNAVYDNDSTFWMATDIQPKPSQLELEIKERSMYKTVNYKVEKILPDRVIVGPGSGSQAQSTDMKLELTKSDLPQVVVGDWLRLSLVAVDSENGGDVSTAKVVKVEFTEKKTRVGTITKYQGRYCVDNTIFFTNEVIEGGRTPQLDDRVRVIAIASDQEVSNFPHHGVVGGHYLFRKRALCITYDNVTSRQTKNNVVSTNGSDDWIDEEPVINSREEYFKELIADKNKVRIRPNRTISFQSKKLKSTSSKVVTIENLSEKTIFLSRILNNGVQDVAKFELIFEEGLLNTNEMLIPLQPHCPWNFEVKCTPYQFGRTKELLTFDFGTFQIGRWLFVHSLAPDQNDTSLYMPDIVGLDWQKRKLGHNPENLMVERNMRVISAPLLVRTPFFIPNKIKSYGVPRNLLRCFKEEDEETLLKLYPTTKDELSYKNYVQRFQVSLWFEEIENLLARREYDMHDVVLQPDRDGHMITVPRLREFYPPVLMGDPVQVFESLKSAEIYRGTIMKILFPDEDPPKILIRFHEKFNRTYDGGPRTVQFGLGRTSFKRMHFAIEHAIDFLGPQWLFPFELTLEEPRICFIEDAEDNYHPAIKACDPQSQQLKQQNSQVVQVVKERQDKRSRSLWSFQGNVTVPFRLDAVYFLEETSRILVTVPSNAAADLIAEKLVATTIDKQSQVILAGDPEQLGPETS
ncbi:unnamed protein product [Allacma fusca]|uniref:Uncharacterized protein n=1 Tax=Allacma fusca TaxID=39272 RepID=A0A8J2J813_9HEXA|nr:unnamed protein product [Allacma fusca]